MTVPAAVPDLGRLYHATRERLVGLLAELDEADLATRVPACPAWLVRDVVAHLCAVSGDVLAGRLTRIATEAETAAQVARFRDHDLAGILAAWQDTAPRFEQLIGARAVWPAVIDIASHEQDIRGAVGRPGGRDAEVIWHGAGWLLTRLRPPARWRWRWRTRSSGPGRRTGRRCGWPPAGSRRSAGGWAAAAGPSSPPLTGPVTRPRCWITSRSSGRPPQTSASDSWPAPALSSSSPRRRSCMWRRLERGDDCDLFRRPACGRYPRC